LREEFNIIFYLNLLRFFIKVDIDEAAKRIWKDLQDKERRLRRNEANYDLETMKKKISERDENDAQRFLKYYKIDHRDESQYDLVIDSTNLSVEEVVGKILEFVKK